MKTQTAGEFLSERGWCHVPTFAAWRRAGWPAADNSRDTSDGSEYVSTDIAVRIEQAAFAAEEREIYRLMLAAVAGGIAAGNQQFNKAHDVAHSAVLRYREEFGVEIVDESTE